MSESRMAVLKRLAPVRERLSALLTAKGGCYPPQAVWLLALKSERVLELWVGDNVSPVFIKDFPILAASGVAGPKLTEGDGQVPEGIYAITALNPESRFYLSLRIDYPNAFDLKWAGSEHRSNPGSDIYIHGGAESAGCLAIGDSAIEELFVLASDTGLANISVAISPHDPRRTDLDTCGKPLWVKALYAELTNTFSGFVTKTA